MKIRSILSIFFFVSLSIVALESKTFDPYKILGVEKSASQREIQKAFHKLSLKYHPDKNKQKGAQEKFAEINNAYEILSDEEKRKRFDLYGDEKANPGFDAGSSAGDHGGYTYFTSGGQGNTRFNFRPDGWPNMGGNGQSESFSYSFGGPSAQDSFGFGLNDIFSFFGGGQSGGGHSGGFGSSKNSHSGSGGSAKFQSGYRTSTNSQSGSKDFSKVIKAVNSRVFQSEVANQGVTWVLLSYVPALKGRQQYESIIGDVYSSLEGALKVGSVNCEEEQSFCKTHGIYPRNSPRVHLYSYRGYDGGSLIEYTDDLSVKSLKTFCQEHLPKFSKRVELGSFDFPSASSGGKPAVMLLSTKKDTPVIWRALSGLYHKHFTFYDARVHDVSDPTVRKLGVDALPAIVGVLPDGGQHVIRTGISVKNLKSAVHDLSILLDGFERKCKKTTSNKSGKTETESIHKEVPMLTASNFDSLCGPSTPVCIIGAFRSSSSRGKLESVLQKVSQKSLSRRPSGLSKSRDSISYSLLDASKYKASLNAFDKSGFKSLDMILVAYKPRREKFAALTSELTVEEVETFISSVLNGDVEFSRTQQKPMIK